MNSWPASKPRRPTPLRFSEARFSGIISISADAIISIDEEQRIVLFNEGAERIFGYSRAEAIGASVGPADPGKVPGRHGGMSPASRRVASRGQWEASGHDLGRRRNGEEFPAEAAISKLQEGDRSILTVALRDVTERKRIEEEQRFLAEAGARAGVVARLRADADDPGPVDGPRLRRLVHRRPRGEATVAQAAEGRQCPRRSCRAGRPLEQLRLDAASTHLASSVLDTRRPYLVERVTPEQLESLPESEEHLQLLRGMEPQSIMGVPLAVRGQLLGILILISSRPSRRYKAEDLRLAEALAERAALAIENGRLYRAAVRATQLRDEVLGVVAHDLRNPLAAITMQATALRAWRARTDRRNPKPIDRILRASDRMNRLIGDLLDVTLIEAGQLGIERTRGVRAADSQGLRRGAAAAGLGGVAGDAGRCL